MKREDFLIVEVIAASYGVRITNVDERPVVNQSGELCREISVTAVKERQVEEIKIQFTSEL